MGEHDTDSGPLATTCERSQETGRESGLISEKPRGDSPNGVARLEVEMMQMRGPLPSPSILHQYSQIPGALELILSMADKEQAHRHSMDKMGMDLAATELRQQGEAADAKVDLARRGQKIGAMVALPLLLGGLVLLGAIAIYAPDVLWVGLVGAVLPVASLGGLVYTFMRGAQPAVGSREPPVQDELPAQETPQLPDGTTSPA